jgi:hypothetical protein
MTTTTSERGLMSDAANAPDEKDHGSEGGSILDDGGIDTDARAGRSLGIEPDKEPDEQTKQEMAQERERRLDPDNRPDNAEVNNSDRTFDHGRGQFTDSEEYDDSEPPQFSDPEDPNNPDNADSDSNGGQASMPPGTGSGLTPPRRR